MIRARRKFVLVLGQISLCALWAAAPVSAQDGGVPAGFTPMFSANSLDGWEGDANYFTMRNGILTVGSPSPIPRNTFLIHKQPYADFELRYRYRWATDEGNSGIQFRSGIAEGHFALAGMQANLTPLYPKERWERFAMLYEELGDRAEMALLGQRAVITRRAAGTGGRGRIVRTVHEMTNPRETIIAAIRPYPEWNDVVLIAHGNRIIHVINGLVVFDATDNDPLARRDGLIGIQAHSGPAMTLEIRDMHIRQLTALPDLGHFTTNPQPAPEPRVTYKDSTRVAMPDVALPDE